MTPGQCADGTGMAVVVNPPSGHGNDNPIQVTLEYDKSVTPGTGVANFEFCIEKLVAGQSVVIDPVPNCKDTAGTPDPFPCIDERHRDNAGDLIVVVPDHGRSDHRQEIAGQAEPDGCRASRCRPGHG